MGGFSNKLSMEGAIDEGSAKQLCGDMFGGNKTMEVFIETKDGLISVGTFDIDDVTYLNSKRTNKRIAHRRKTIKWKRKHRKK